VNAARVSVRAGTLGLRVAVAELTSVRLRWCLLCGRIGLWCWRPLTPSMPITWVCTNGPGCQRRQGLAGGRWERGWRARQVA
jgi:hypothetical protein